MAYSLPPKDDRSSSYFSPHSSDRSYFTEQAIRTGYSISADSRDAEFQRYPNDFRDPVDWEMERERIRLEMKEKEMARRRILEDEVRRELMMDREIAMQRWEDSRMRSDGPSGTSQFGHETSRIHHHLSDPHFEERMMFSRPVAGFDAPSRAPHFAPEPSRIHHLSSPRYEERMLLSRPGVDAPSGAPQFAHEPSRIRHPPSHYEERMLPSRPVPLMPSRPVAGVGGSQSSPYLHPPMMVAYSSLGHREIKHHPEPRKETMMSARREANISDRDRKRKASTLGADHHGGGNSEKKPRRWFCELCNVSATSESNLKAHLTGKKHQLMVEGVPLETIGTASTPEARKASVKPSVQSRISSSPAIKELPVDTAKPNNTSGSTSDPDRKKAPKATTEVKQGSKPNSSLKTQKPGGPSTTPTTEDKKQGSKPNNLLKTQKPGPSTTPIKPGSAKKFKYWCKVCQVGANSEVVLSAHEKGKRHLANLEELNAAPGSSSANGQTASIHDPKQQIKLGKK